MRPSEKERQRRQRLIDPYKPRKKAVRVFRFLNQQDKPIKQIDETKP